MSFPPLVAGERSTTKTVDTKNYGLFMSVVLHFSILFTAIFFWHSSSPDSNYNVQSNTGVMQARLVFTPSRLPTIEDDGASDKPKESERLPDTSTINKSDPVKDKVVRASDRFDDALALAEIAVLKIKSVELQRTALEPATAEPEVVEPIPAKKIRLPQLEKPIEARRNVDAPLIRKKSVKQDDAFSIDPLLAYQQKIGMTLQRNLRLSEYEKIGRCVLQMELSRDGMVLDTAYVSGSKTLCGEAKKAAIRVGKMPMPADDALYGELTTLYVTVIGTGL
jgi:hypothetical protein